MKPLAVLLLALVAACTLEDFVDTARVDSYHLENKGIPNDQFELFDVASGGGTVKAVHVERPDGVHRTILYCHGVAANIETSWVRVVQWYELGFDILLFDYRGYGASSGSSWSEASLYADAEAAYLALLARGAAASDVFLYGHSFGGPVAAELALRHEPGALVLESTLTNMPEQIRSNTYFATPDSFLSKLELDTKDKVARMGGFQKLIMHGTKDVTWPVWNGREIFEAATPLKRLFLCEGCSHTSVMLGDHARYREQLCFAGAPAPLDQCLPLAASGTAQ
jgi:pimeloyl-ACP methyl ester carboxylesterase